MSGLSPEPRRPSDYISRCKQAGKGRAIIPQGLEVELHPPHSSLFHSLFLACISFLQLRVIMEWVGAVAGRLELGGNGEWATWLAP